MDDSGFKSTRLSLMIISIGIIIFILGEGTINKANIFFGSIDLKDDAPVKITAVLVYMYLLWRYWLYKDHVIGKFGDEFKKYFYQSSDYANIALKIAKTCKNKEDGYDLELAIMKYRLNQLHYKTIKNEGGGGHITTYIYPILLDNYLYPEFLYAPVREMDLIKKMGGNPNNLPNRYAKGKDEIFKISTLQFILLELIVLSKMIFVKRSFADFLLPLVIAGYTGYLLLNY